MQGWKGSKAIFIVFRSEAFDYAMNDYTVGPDVRCMTPSMPQLPRHVGGLANRADCKHRFIQLVCD